MYIHLICKPRKCAIRLTSSDFLNENERSTLYTAGHSPARGSLRAGKEIANPCSCHVLSPRSCSTVGDPSWSSSIDCDDMLFMATPELSLDCATGRPLILT